MAVPSHAPAGCRTTFKLQIYRETLEDSCDARLSRRLSGNHCSPREPSHPVQQAFLLLNGVTERAAQYAAGVTRLLTNLAAVATGADRDHESAKQQHRSGDAERQAAVATGVREALGLCVRLARFRLDRFRLDRFWLHWLWLYRIGVLWRLGERMGLMSV